MSCDNQVGVRNILIKFYDCDSGAVLGPVSHELASEEQPTYRTCDSNNEALPGGYTRRTKGNKMMSLSVIRNLGIPLAMYQGCASLDITVEHFNGKVMTGIGGTPTGEESSDGHEVSMEIVFRDIDELLPSVLASVA